MKIVKKINNLIRYFRPNLSKSKLGNLYILKNNCNEYINNHNDANKIIDNVNNFDSKSHQSFCSENDRYSFYSDVDINVTIINDNQYNENYETLYNNNKSKVIDIYNYNINNEFTDEIKIYYTGNLKLSYDSDVFTLKRRTKNISSDSSTIKDNISIINDILDLY